MVEACGAGKALGWTDDAHCRHLDTPGQLNVIKVHSTHQLVGVKDAIRDGWATYLYSYRDLRDVIISIQHKWNLEFPQVLQACYLDYIMWEYKNWTSLPGGHISKYETFVDNPNQEAHAIAAHLNLSLPDGEIATLASQYSLQNQKARMARLRDTGRKVAVDGILHADHVFSGATDQWRSLLKPYQIGYLEYKTHDWLAKHGYDISQPRLVQYIGLLYFQYCVHVAKRKQGNLPDLF